MRVRVRRFLAVPKDEARLFLCHDDRCPSLSHPASTRGQDHQWSPLPAKFSPSRVVRPSGVFVSGSWPSVLRPLLTSAPSQRPLLAAAPAVAGEPREQISLSKNVNDPGTTAPFTSGTEHRTSLCLASSSAPSALYGISVRRLTGLTSASFPRDLAIPQLPWSSAWAILPSMNGRPNDRVPAPGTCTPFVHAHVRRTKALEHNCRPASPLRLVLVLS